jgi:protein-L-isoaspartate(D-aspartate) O-methyltransferase
MPRLASTIIPWNALMMDFAAARRTMVDGQVRTSDVSDLRIIDAMLDVPRERFVPVFKAGLAYADFDIPVTESRPDAPARHLLKPMVLAKLIQAAGIGERDIVLDVGCASGYSSAVLARLAGPVIALEEDEELAEVAGANLKALGAGNVTVAMGPLVAGWPGGAPYDVVLLNGATEITPKALLQQLKPGGRLLGIFGRSPAGKAMRYRATGAEVSGRPIFDAAAPLLPGFVAPPEFVF